MIYVGSTAHVTTFRKTKGVIRFRVSSSAVSNRALVTLVIDKTVR